MAMCRPAAAYVTYLDEDGRRIRIPYRNRAERAGIHHALQVGVQQREAVAEYERRERDLDVLERWL